MKTRLVALIIVLIISVAMISTFAYYAFQPSQQYYPLMTTQWETPPITNTTAPFTITGKEWYVHWTFVSYGLVSSSLDVSVRNASTNAVVEDVTLTNAQPMHYFNTQGTFYLSIRLNNATNVFQNQILVDVYELK